MPTPTHIALIGGGHAHALVLRRFAQKPDPGVTLHVFDPQSPVAYTGMLPGLVAGHYDTADLSIDIQSLAHAAGGIFHPSAVVNVDPDTQKIYTADDTTPYDLVSFDVGIRSRSSLIEGAEAQAIGVKPLTAFATTWEPFVCDCVRRSTPSRVVVVGGGVAGVEVALAMAHRLQRESGHVPALTILERGDLLTDVSPRTRQVLKTALARYQITGHEQVAVERITASLVVLKDGTEIPSDFTLLATGPQPYEWLANCGLPLSGGYINVDATLRSPDYPNVFAVGDCAHFLPHPLPKAGVYAVREAEVLYTNLRALAHGTPLKKYTPQRDYLKLISLGDRRAVAEKWGWTLSGSWLWQLKNHIDRKFMRRLTVPSPPRK